MIRRHSISTLFPYTTLFRSKIILNYLPIYKFKDMGASTLRWSGLEQFRLLYSIPYDLLSPAGKRRFDEWGRKLDRKSTRLNSSHGYISYAVFCLKKKRRNDQ